MRLVAYIVFVLFGFTSFIAETASYKEAVPVQIHTDLTCPHGHDPLADPEARLAMDILMAEVHEWFEQYHPPSLKRDLFHWSGERPKGVRNLRLAVLRSNTPGWWDVASMEPGPVILNVPPNETNRTIYLYLFLDRITKPWEEFDPATAAVRIALSMGKEIYGNIQYILEHNPDDQTLDDEALSEKNENLGVERAYEFIAQIFEHMTEETFPGLKAALQRELSEWREAFCELNLDDRTNESSSHAMSQFLARWQVGYHQ